MASEIQRIRRKDAVQMKHHVLSGKDANLVINVLTEIRWFVDSSCIHEDTTVWLFQKFLNGPILPAIKA